jgi:hypothetical protein
MEGKELEDNAINRHLTENVWSCNSALLEKLPNLMLGNCELAVYGAMGFQLTKKGYFGLAFSLNDDRHLNLSNGCLELKNGTVKIGVTKLENLQAILQAPFLKPGSMKIVTSAFTLLEV